jgi:hypothetical protein
MKSTTLCYVTPCSLQNVQRRIEGTYCVNLQWRRMRKGSNKWTPVTLLAYFCLNFLFDPENGDNQFLRNVAEILPSYTASHSKR